MRPGPPRLQRPKWLNGRLHLTWMGLICQRGRCWETSPTRTGNAGGRGGVLQGGGGRGGNRGYNQLHRSLDSSEQVPPTKWTPGGRRPSYSLAKVPPLPAPGCGIPTPGGRGVSPLASGHVYTANFQLCFPTLVGGGRLDSLALDISKPFSAERPSVHRGRECGRGHRRWETTRLSWVPTLDRGQVCSKQHLEGGFAPSTSPEQPGPPPAMMSVVQRQGLPLVSLPGPECPGRTPKMPLLAQEPRTRTGLHTESRPKAPTVIFQTLNLVTL